MAPGLAQMRLSEFLSQLPKVQNVTDDEECPVCLQIYLPITAPTAKAPGIIQGFLSMFGRQEPEPIEPEYAVRLPCQHVIGSKCIKRWLSSEEGHNTCPYCVKQLFTPLDRPYCNHPDWDMLMGRLGDYGFVLTRSWTWIWRRSEAIARITKKDILDYLMLAKPAATTLTERLFADKNAVDALRSHHRSAKFFADFDPERPWTADQETVDVVLLFTSLHLTLHLRETAWYLCYEQQWRTNLSPLGRLSREYPFRTLQKHHEDALFRETERDGVFENRIGSLPDRELWNVWRDMGLNPKDRINVR